MLAFDYGGEKAKDCLKIVRSTIITTAQLAEGRSLMTIVLLSAAGVPVLAQTNLSVSDWITAASGSANPATLPATNGAQFYRLSQP